MVRVFSTVLLVLGLTPVAASAQNTVPATGGDITITPIQHATVQIEHAGKVIQVDPAQGDLSKAKPGDLVLVTDIHGDHLSPDGIAKVRKSGAPVVMPAAVQTQVSGKVTPPIEVMANGESKTVAGVAIEAVPMYNLTRGPAAGQLFHTKGRGNGYVVTLGGKRIYISGDTEDIPEMRGLKNIDAAFVCMNLPYTMDVEHAADAVLAFKPKVVYPYHYRGKDGLSDVEKFKSLVAKDKGIEVRLLKWYK